MSVSIVYDLSRLTTRVLHATPNGIDRIDLLLAQHFCAHGEFSVHGLGLGFAGPRLLSNDVARNVAARAAAAWREDAEGGKGRTYQRIVARLLADGSAGGARAPRIVSPRPGRPLNIAGALFRHLAPGSFSRSRSAPCGAVYINVTHFPLEWKHHVAWLRQRPDIRPVFWIHDLFPIDRPDWFWGRESALHELRLETLARFGAAAIVASAFVESDLRKQLDRFGKADLPIFRFPPPTQAIFREPPILDKRLADAPYFIVCGTIEPRKNHLLLLDVWRNLVRTRGSAAPKLLVIGKRGWNCANIVAALQDESLAGHVIEVAGLPTPDYKALLDNCRALLAPSLAEGFGLPLAEALAAGVPVIASDIPPYREQDGAGVTYIDPRSADAWRQAILGAAAAGPSPVLPRSNGRSPDERLEEFDDFLRRVALGKQVEANRRQDRPLHS